MFKPTQAARLFASMATRPSVISSMQLRVTAVRTFAATKSPAAAKAAPAEKKPFNAAEALGKLRERARNDPFVSNPADSKNPQVFFDIEIEGKPAGRVIMEVRVDKAPKAGENFRALCTGEKGSSSTGTVLSYKNTKIFGWMKNYFINGGDIVSNNGKGGESVYGPSFRGEISDLPMGLGSVHLLDHTIGSPESWVSKRDVVNSRFSILTVDLPSVLTGMGVVVAQVLKGIEVVEDIQHLPYKFENKQLVAQAQVRISNCGQLSESEKIKPTSQAAAKH